MCKIGQLRREVLDNIHLMSNTRPTKSAFHIAGFHRHLELEHLHCEIAGNERVLETLNAIYDQGSVVALGITDITINRSQPWHTDLLRGKYAHFLDKAICWNMAVSPCLKALVFLQDCESLEVVPGSHVLPVDLSSDLNVVPQDMTKAKCVSAKTGDVILMDIRLIHRGATEDKMSSKGLDDNAKILISTVFGEASSPLAQSMQVGNMRRLIDWEIRNATIL